MPSPSGWIRIQFINRFRSKIRVSRPCFSDFLYPPAHRYNEMATLRLRPTFYKPNDNPIGCCNAIVHAHGYSTGHSVCLSNRPRLYSALRTFRDFKQDHFAKTTYTSKTSIIVMRQTLDKIFLRPILNI